MSLPGERAPDPDIIDVISHHENIPGVRPIIVALAQEDPQNMHRLAWKAYSNNAEREANNISDDDPVITETTSPALAEDRVALAAKLANEVFEQRKEPERLLKKVGTALGVSALAATTAVALGFYFLSDTPAEQNPTGAETSVEAPTSHKTTSIGNILLPGVFIVGGLGSLKGSLLIGKFVGDITSHAGAGRLTRRRARKEVGRAKTRNNTPEL